MGAQMVKVDCLVRDKKAALELLGKGRRSTLPQDDLGLYDDTDDDKSESGIFDSDEEVQKLYKKKNKNLINQLKKIGLGKSVKKNNINKKTIAKIIFSNKNIKIKLEKFIFKIVRKKRNTYVKKEKRKNTSIIIMDIPLLFENNLDYFFDTIISVVAKRKVRLKRVKLNKKITKEAFNKILKNQTTDVERRKRSDIILENNSTKKIFLKKVNMLIKRVTV